MIESRYLILQEIEDNCVRVSGVTNYKRNLYIAITINCGCRLSFKKRRMHDMIELVYSLCFIILSKLINEVCLLMLVL